MHSFNAPVLTFKEKFHSPGTSVCIPPGFRTQPGIARPSGTNLRASRACSVTPLGISHPTWHHEVYPGLAMKMVAPSLRIYVQSLQPGIPKLPRTLRHKPPGIQRRRLTRPLGIPTLPGHRRLTPPMVTSTS